MSHSASLDVVLAPGGVRPSEIVRALLHHGWRADDQGRIFYADMGMDDWKNAGLERLDEVLDQMDDGWNEGKAVGISLVWGDFQSGGQFLFWKPREISFLANINRHTLDQKAEATDTDWYVERLLPALKSVGQAVESMEWTELA